MYIPENKIDCEKLDCCDKCVYSNKSKCPFEMLF